MSENNRNTMNENHREYHSENSRDNDGFEDLEEGALYVYKKGVLHEIESDPDDLMKRIKVTPDAFAKVSQLQRGMRKQMQGYRPDLSMICSGLLAHSAQSEEAQAVVRQYVLNMYQSATQESGS